MSARANRAGKARRAPARGPGNLRRGLRLAMVSALGPVCTACVTLSDMAGSVRDAFAPVPAQADGTVGSPQARRPASPHEAGSLHFILADTGWGDYSGWRLQVLAARAGEGLNPLLSAPMEAGQHLKLALWPDSYRVRVLLGEDVHSDMWVDVLAGQPTVIYVDIGFLGNRVVLLQGEEALRRIAEAHAPTRELTTLQTFAPLRAAQGGSAQDPDGTVTEDAPGSDARASEPAGHEARAAARSGVDPMGMSGLQAAISALEKNIGKAAPAPAGGASGTAHAPVEAFNEPPRPTLPAPAEPMVSGCGMVQGRFKCVTTLDAAEPSAASPGGGCAGVQGKFTTSTGLSRLSFDAGGSGSLWQQTYGGAATYTFDVDFRWRGSADSMHFEYGEAVYRDAGGREMQRRPLPGGSASCSYDGRELAIGGVRYFRQ